MLKFDIVDMDGNVQEELLESIRKEGRILYEKILEFLCFIKKYEENWLE